MPFLVCGVGYIGSALSQHLLDAGHEVVGFDNFFSTDARAIATLAEHPSFTFVEGDVADESDVRRTFDSSQFDAVFLLAAQSSGDDRAVPAEYTERTNLSGPRIVLRECVRRSVPRVVFGSSLRVYGQPLPAEFDEGTPYGRQTDLSHLSKLYAEKLLELFAATNSLSAVSARLAIVYGLGPVMKKDASFMTVANRFAWRATQGEPLIVNEGMGAVSLLHLDDAVRALVACLDFPLRGYTPVNVLGEWIGLADLARLVCEEGVRAGFSVDSHLPIEPAPEHPCGRSRLFDRGFERRRGVRDGVRELLGYFSTVQAA